jgi:hypothetical protein
MPPPSLQQELANSHWLTCDRWLINRTVSVLIVGISVLLCRGGQVPVCVYKLLIKLRASADI